MRRSISILAQMSLACIQVYLWLRMVIVIVDGKEYNLTENQVAIMPYIQEAQALEKGHHITIHTITTKTFDFILRVIHALDYTIIEPPKIKSSVIEDHIGKDLAKFIGHLDVKQLNELYRAVHYLKIRSFRKCISAVMACRIYIEPTLDNYQRRKAEVGPQRDLTSEKSKEYKERFPFIN